jgi:hypothetical protein
MCGMEGQKAAAEKKRGCDHPRFGLILGASEPVKQSEANG